MEGPATTMTEARELMERQAPPLGRQALFLAWARQDGADSPLKYCYYLDGQQDCTTCRTILSK